MKDALDLSALMSTEDIPTTGKRKKYKFARFAERSNCYEAGDWAIKTHLPFPAVIELGAGTGYFSVELAQQYPEIQFIAVDVKADRLQAGARRALKNGVDNLSFLRAHAEQLPELLPAHSISELWLTFCDPYPKARHAKHRLSHPRFLSTYRQLLVNDGRLHVKTDSHELFDWSLEQLVGNEWHIKALTFDLHRSRFPAEYKIMTTYEQRFVAGGLPIYAATVSACR